MDNGIIPIEYAIITVSDGTDGLAWPVVTRVPGGWQSGAHHYPDSVVQDVTPLHLSLDPIPAPTEIVYSVPCHCGEDATTTALLLGQPEDDGRIHIDLEMAASQESLYCEACGCVTYTGDLDMSCEEEEDCGGESDTDDESEDDAEDES